MSLKVGAKVKCIDDSNYDRKYNEIIPALGATYTVRALYGTCVRLKEIINFPHQYLDGFMECSFKASRFALVKGRGR